MNHEVGDKFLDAIVASPEDHTTRLVYADFLDDNDIPDVATMWRAQVHFPHEWKGTLAQFLNIAPFLSLFPMLAWVEIADVFDSHQSRHELIISQIWSDRLTNILIAIGIMSAKRRPQVVAAALSVSALEYVWALRPVCDECIEWSQSLDLCNRPKWMCYTPGENRVFLCPAHKADQRSLNGHHDAYTFIPLPRSR